MPVTVILKHKKNFPEEAISDHEDSEGYLRLGDQLVSYCALGLAHISLWSLVSSPW